MEIDHRFGETDGAAGDHLLAAEDSRTSDDQRTPRQATNTNESSARRTTEPFLHEVEGSRDFKDTEGRDREGVPLGFTETANSGFILSQAGPRCVPNNFKEIGRIFGTKGNLENDSGRNSMVIRYFPIKAGRQRESCGGFTGPESMSESGTFQDEHNKRNCTFITEKLLYDQNRFKGCVPYNTNVRNVEKIPGDFMEGVLLPVQRASFWSEHSSPDFPKSNRRSTATYERKEYDSVCLSRRYNIDGAGQERNYAASRSFDESFARFGVHNKHEEVYSYSNSTSTISRSGDRLRKDETLYNGGTFEKNTTRGPSALFVIFPIIVEFLLSFSFSCVLL